MPYSYTDYYAAVQGYSVVKVNFPQETSSWVDGETVNIGSPAGQAVVYRVSGTTFYDDQYAGTLYSDLTPLTSASFARKHPGVGTGNYVNNTNAGVAFGVYGSGDSAVLLSQNRDAIPSASQFIVIGTNLTSALSPGTKLYNTNHTTVAATTNLTSSWRLMNPANKLSGTAVGNVFTRILTDDQSKYVIYAFGGQDVGNVNTNWIFYCTASVDPTDVNGTTLRISPWYRTDGNGYSWPGDVIPGGAGPALTIPIVPGVKDGASCIDASSKTIYFGGGIRQTYVGSPNNIFGYDKIYGWRYNSTTGMLTGSAFVAGQMPMGRYSHEMFVANGFLYCVGGAMQMGEVSGTVADNPVYFAHIDRAIILDDGVLADWAMCHYEMPQGVDSVNSGTGLVDGAAFIYPTNAYDTGNRNIYIIGGLKQFLTTSGGITSYVTRSSAQGYSAPLIYVQGTSVLANPNKLGIDSAWQGPSTGEILTAGAQLGPNDIKPVLPMLDNIYQQLIYSAVPSSMQQLTPNSRITGYRPGLKGTEINGIWKFRFATTPGTFNPNGDLTQDHWPSLTSSQVYFRQLRIEFLVDETAGYSDIQYFNPARERLYRKSGVGFKNGKKLIDIISGSSWWDAGISYIYTSVQPEYGRTVGITNSSASDDYAVFTQLTGALATYLTGTPNWFLNPPPGEGMPGLPYIPLSSASFGEASQPYVTSSSADMLRATVDQQLPNPADATLAAYLSRIRAIRTTQDLYEEQLGKSSTGSYF